MVVYTTIETIVQFGARVQDFGPYEPEGRLGGPHIMDEAIYIRGEVPC